MVIGISTQLARPTGIGSNVMNESVVFNNPVIKGGHTEGSWTVAEPGSATAAVYKAEDYAIQVTVTKKFKPYKDGTLITITLAAINVELHQRIRGVWFYMFLADAFDDWTESDYTDADFRNGVDGANVIFEPVVSLA